MLLGTLRRYRLRSEQVTIGSSSSVDPLLILGKMVPSRSELVPRRKVRPTRWIEVQQRTIAGQPVRRSYRWRRHLPVHCRTAQRERRSLRWMRLPVRSRPERLMEMQQQTMPPTGQLR